MKESGGSLGEPATVRDGADLICASRRQRRADARSRSCALATAETLAPGTLASASISPSPLATSAPRSRRACFQRIQKHETFYAQTCAQTYDDHTGRIPGHPHHRRPRPAALHGSRWTLTFESGLGSCERGGLCRRTAAGIGGGVATFRPPQARVASVAFEPSSCSGANLNAKI